MKLKQFIFAIVAMLSSFAFTANAQTAVSSFDELKAALANSTDIVVNADIAVDEAITIPSGTTVAGDGTLHVQTKVYVVSTENPYPGVTYNKTATKNGSISGSASCAVVYEISLDGGENWFTDTTNGKAQAVTVKKDGTKTISTSFQSAFTSAKCGEIVHMLKDAHVQSTNSKKNNGPLRSYYGLILEGNGHTIYTDVESSGASNEYSTIKFTSYLAGTGADVRPVLKNVTIDSQKNAKADLDIVSGDVTFTVSLFNVNLLGNCVYASFPVTSSSLVLNKSNVKLFDSTIPRWDASSANAIEFYSGDYSLSFNGKCKVYGGSFSKDATNYLADRAEMSTVNGKYVVTCKEEKVEVAPSVGTAVEDEVANEIVANEAVANNSVELPADVASFTVQLTAVESENEATTKVTFTVTPSNVLGEKVSTPTEAITFRLPVPAAWSGKAKVYHNGAELGVYDINEENGAKYVEVTSANFSEFTVEAFDPAAGKVAKIGENYYATLSEAFAAVTDDNQTVVLLADVTENLAGAYLRGNITTENGAKVTVNLTNSDWVYCPYTFVLGENITLNVPALFYYAGGAQINGTVVAGAYYQRYTGTKLTINEPGSMTVTSETCIIRYMEGDPNAGIYVVGDNNNETIGLKLSVAYFYQGMINAKDANLQVGTYWQTNETDGQGSANLVLDNSTLNVTVNEHDFKATGNSTVTLTNGSSIDIAGAFKTGENTKVSVDATSSITDKNGQVEFGLSGKGTEASPYLIASLDDLKFFRDKVNADDKKYNAAGVYFELANDIDMTGENWVGIGSINADHGFMGNFDGKNFVVKNLTINNPALVGSYAYAGLFSITEGTDNNQNFIKNLTIENVTINTTGQIVSAAIAYPYYTIIENVKVCGNIAIEGGDYTAGVLAYTRRCVNASNISIIGNENSYVKGNQVVGGVISDIQMNGGLIADYSNFSAEGVTISGTKMVGGISGIIAKQTLNGAAVKNVTLSSGDSRVGTIAGSFGGTSTISDVTVENVTGATAVIGATYDGAKAVEARIGDTFYATLAEAIAASPESGWGGEVTLLKDITLEGGYADADEGLRIEKSVTINGAGHTIDCGKFKKGIRIYENGNLASNVMFKNVNIVNNNDQGRCIDTRSAKINLMLNGGVNLTAHGTNSQPLTIGGSEAMTKVTISGGTIDAGTSGYGVICFVPVTNNIHVQSNAVIKGFAAFYLKEGVTNTAIKLSQATSIGTNKYAAASGDFGAIVIEGSNNAVRLEHRDAVVKAVAGDGAEMAAQAAFLLRGNNNTVGYYNNADAQVVTEGGQAYWTLSDADVTGTKYERNGVEMLLEAETCGYQFITVEEALRYAKDGDTVKLLANAELDETYVNEKSLTLDLNGKTLTGTPAEDAAYAVITNKGTLTIEGEGAVICNHTLAGSTSYAVNTITNCGTLVIDGATIENKSTASNQIGYAIDNNSTSYDATAVIGEGAVIKVSGSAYYDGIRMFCNSTTAKNDVVVEGGNVSSIWMQNPSDGAEKNTKDVNGSVTIEGGEVTALYLEPSANFEAAITAGYVGNVSYFQTAAGRDLVKFITGGTFGMDVTELCALGYLCKANTDGTYSVDEDPNYIAELEIIDGVYGDYTNDADKTVGKLTYVRTLPAAGIWYPVFLPFDVPVGALAENFDVARINDLHTDFSEEDGSIEKMWVEYIVRKSGTLAAGKPFLVRAKSSDVLDMVIELEEVKLYASDKKSTITVSSAITKVTFEGVYEATSGFVSTPSTRYMAVNANGVWDEFDSYPLNPFRVLMTLEILDEEYYVASAASLSVGARVIGEENEDGTTTIYDVEADREENDMIFDLQGRRVLETEKGGIYIKNGKKFIVK